MTELFFTLTYWCECGILYTNKQTVQITVLQVRASQGFDRGSAAGEAIRRLMR